MNDVRKFSAVLSSLPQILEWVTSHLKASGLSDVEIRRIEIALEEAFVNIISYAYPQEEGAIELDYSVYPGDAIEIKITDWGIPFNPMKQVTDVDTALSLEEREVGGLGILFIRKLMDKVEYMRFQEANILTLRKNLNASD